MELSNEILSDITVHMKYAKYIPELNRRESWDDLVTRNKLMHIKKYPELKENIEEVVRTTADSLNVNASALIHPARLALTGFRVSPGLFEVMALLGKETVIKRLEKALTLLP